MVAWGAQNGHGEKPQENKNIVTSVSSKHRNMRETCDGGTLYPDWLDATALAVIGEGVTSGETGISDSSYTLPVIYTHVPNLTSASREHTKKRKMKNIEIYRCCTEHFLHS